MPFACPPPLRFALHLLLALAVLLQASMAVAMHAPAGVGPAAGATTVSRDHPTAGPSLLPPCHASPDAGTTDVVSKAAPSNCCTEGLLSESCRWACAQALSLPVVLMLGAAPSLASTGVPAPLLPALRWIARTPLRPPIG